MELYAGLLNALPTTSPDFACLRTRRELLFGWEYRVKKLALAFLFFMLAFPPAAATTYYLAPAAAGGRDANNGTSTVTPWLTPNHPLNCRDVILAAPGAYAEENFRPGQWGVVTCPTGNDVAWLKCATFDACKINISSASHNAMTPTESYWGIQGWEVTASYLSGNQCFEAYPPDLTHTIHHIIFANNIANGCGDGGFTSGASAANVGTDYIVIIGNIAYNAAQDNANCYSGIDVTVPVNSDTTPGTHIYIAGNFVWGNVDPNPCSHTVPTDGQGINVDTVNEYSYSGQIVIDNNISVFNGAAGIQSFLNRGSSPNARIYIRYNTVYGNQNGRVNANPCAEINLNHSLSSTVYSNLVKTGAATGCRGTIGIYAIGVTSGDSTDVIYGNALYSVAGNNISGATGGPGNLTGTNPNFVNPVLPSAPNCSNASSVPNCMATVIANFTPRSAASTAYGYQPPVSYSTYDPLFPQWLCNVNLPAGLVTMGCLAQSSVQPSTATTGLEVFNR